ncbi:hypothetical protein ACJIZ3_015902 [Penstemon smallii]|uniref:TRF2/HOY1 PH-like domain-containing protein n=1 Tax=Penstemon smallii TaxID=265156 RepID=A0ABD3RPL9_9LAMI
MSESDRTVFLNEKEEGYGGDFTSQDLVNNQYFESHAEFQNSDESVSKKIRLSEEFNHQEGDGDSSAESSPLGLTLRKTPSFLSLLETKLSKGKQEIDRISYNERSRTNIHDLGYEKLKASNFPAVQIKIGAWQRISKHEGDLVAKLYYAKRKIVWEVLGGALKSKIEIHWSNIIAIRGIIADENEPGILEIELNEPPLFYRETNPQPRKHTLWQQASDFTGGQAPRILDKHYEKLLQCDKQLFDLSQKPFPSQQSPYFQNFFTTTTSDLFSLNFNGPGPGSGSGFPFQQYPRPPTPNSSLLLSATGT